MSWKSRILIGLACVLFPCATVIGALFIVMLFSSDRNGVVGAAALLVPIVPVWYVSFRILRKPVAAWFASRGSLWYWYLGLYRPSKLMLQVALLMLATTGFYVYKLWPKERPVNAAILMRFPSAEDLQIALGHGAEPRDLEPGKRNRYKASEGTYVSYATFTEAYAFDGKVYQVVSGYSNYIRHPAAAHMYQELIDGHSGSDRVNGKDQYGLEAFAFSESETASFFLGMRKNALYHIEIKPGLAGGEPRMLDLLSRKLKIVE
ncbi:MAG: hypothetical protein JF616_02400 [Fibrobacteres bacterium]|jgi:hypothetical protein|nr:hypothetical protein [Fibrobacterota bacterium]